MMGFDDPGTTRPMTDAAAAPKEGERLACSPDRGFVEWLSACGGTIAVSTYQAGKLLLIGWNGQQPSLLPRHFDKPMGFDVLGDRMVLSTRNHITMFANDAILAHHYQHDKPGRYDALYLPRLSYHTADLNTHDVALSDSDVWILNTRFSCLCGLSDRWTFLPRWRPKFVTDLVPEDRCHLNGLTMVNGEPGYVTCLGETDTVGGWRDVKVGGGIVMDVRANEVVLRGLSMPHSPRWHDGQLWVLNSGEGRLLRVNPANGQADVVCELPGYLRGLAFVGTYALVGLCKIRETNVFGGMPIQERYPELQCAVSVVDTRSGREVGRFSITAGCTEIYDIRFLKGKSRVNVLNLDREESRQAFNAPPDVHYWLRPENEIADDTPSRA
jgi:uncharacterized protein (TIGR03032 family)